MKSKVVLNGVHIINYINNSKTKNEFTIGLVSRFVERKRIDRLVSAFNYFIKSGAKGKLVLVGDGKTFENIKSLINKYKLEEYVDLTGYKTNVSDFYDLFDICVFPKKNHLVTRSRVLLFGKPVLVFKDSGGLKEIVSPIEPKNVVDDELELSERMIYYYKNKRMIYEKSAKRQSYAKDFYSIQKMERNYFKVYNCILKT